MVGVSVLALLAVCHIVRFARIVDGVPWTTATGFVLFPPACWWWLISRSIADPSKAGGTFTKCLAMVVTLTCMLLFQGFLGAISSRAMAIPLLTLATLWWFSLPLTVVVGKLRRRRL